MHMTLDPVIKDVLPYPIYKRAPHITALTGSQAHDLEIMERAERIDKICNVAKSLYARGLDPNDYADEIFESVGIDVDSLSSDEIDKINRACR